MLRAVLRWAAARPLVVVLLLLTTALAAQTARVAVLGSQLAEASLAVVNAEADADTTRLRLIDGVRVYSRLATQSSLRADSLDRALASRPVVRVAAAVEIDEAEGETAGDAAPTTTPGILGATFEDYRSPIRLRADVTIPDPGVHPDLTPKMAWRVIVDPVRIGVRVSCGAVRPGGAAPASIDVTDAPSWARVRLDAVQTDRDVCSASTAMGAGVGAGDVLMAVLVGGAGGALAGGATAERPGHGVVMGGLVGAAAGAALRLLLSAL